MGATTAQEMGSIPGISPFQPSVQGVRHPQGAMVDSPARGHGTSRGWLQVSILAPLVAFHHHLCLIQHLLVTVTNSGTRCDESSGLESTFSVSGKIEVLPPLTLYHEALIHCIVI